MSKNTSQKAKAKPTRTRKPKSSAKPTRKPKSTAKPTETARSPKDVGLFANAMADIYEAMQRILTPGNAEPISDLKQVEKGVKAMHEAALSRLDLETDGALTAQWLHAVLVDAQRAGAIASRAAYADKLAPDVHQGVLSNAADEWDALRDRMLWHMREAQAAWPIAEGKKFARREVEIAERETEITQMKDAAECVAHSIDYRAVKWHNGEEYTFTATQAACVKIWWQHWEHKTPDVGDNALLETAEVQSPLRILFRGHPAWGAMIREGATKGTHRLADKNPQN